MASTAISAQGSTLEIGTGTGSALTITAASKNAPCVLTLSAVTGLAIGSVGVIAAIVGMTELNGVKAQVQYISGTKIALAGIDSNAYTTYASGGTWTPVTFTKIANVKTFGGLDGEAAEMETSNLDSTATEYLLGLRDEGTFTFDVDYDFSDAGQTAADAARTTSTLKDFRLTLPNARVATFKGYVKKFGKAGGVSQTVKSSVTVRISGPVTWA